MRTKKTTFHVKFDPEYPRKGEVIPEFTVGHFTIGNRARLECA